MEQLVAQLQTLAQKGLEAKDPDTNIVGKLIATVVFFSTLWWTQYQLAKAERALASAKADADRLRLKAEYDLFVAQSLKLNTEAERLANIASDGAMLAQKKIATQQQQLYVVKTNLDKISRWEDLNTLAGVKL